MRQGPGSAQIAPGNQAVEQMLGLARQRGAAGSGYPQAMSVTAPMYTPGGSSGANPNEAPALAAQRDAFRMRLQQAGFIYIMAPLRRVPPFLTAGGRHPQALLRAAKVTQGQGVP